MPIPSELTIPPDYYITVEGRQFPRVLYDTTDEGCGVVVSLESPRLICMFDIDADKKDVAYYAKEFRSPTLDSRHGLALFNFVALESGLTHESLKKRAISILRHIDIDMKIVLPHAMAMLTQQDLRTSVTEILTHLPLPLDSEATYSSRFPLPVAPRVKGEEGVRHHYLDDRGFEPYLRAPDIITRVEYAVQITSPFMVCTVVKSGAPAAETAQPFTPKSKLAACTFFEPTDKPAHELLANMAFWYAMVEGPRGQDVDLSASIGQMIRDLLGDDED